MNKKTTAVSIIGPALISLVLGFYSGRYFERANTRKNFQNVRENFQERQIDGTRRTDSYPEGSIPSRSQSGGQQMPLPD